MGWAEADGERFDEAKVGEEWRGGVSVLKLG